jgi:hypothetical protein
VTNISGPEYDDELLDFQDQHRKILATWGTVNGLNYDIIDPTCSVNPTEPTLRKRVTSSSGSLWGRGDGVHLSPGGYQDLAWAIGEAADSELSTEGMSSVLEGSKRKRPDSVVTLPPAPRAKKGRGGINAPGTTGWLCGVADTDTGHRVTPSGFSPFLHPRGGRGSLKGTGMEGKMAEQGRTMVVWQRERRWLVVADTTNTVKTDIEVHVLRVKKYFFLV